MRCAHGCLWLVRACVLCGCLVHYIGMNYGMMRVAYCSHAARHDSFSISPPTADSLLLATLFIAFLLAAVRHARFRKHSLSDHSLVTLSDHSLSPHTVHPRPYALAHIPRREGLHSAHAPRPHVEAGSASKEYRGWVRVVHCRAKLQPDCKLHMLSSASPGQCQSEAA